MIHINFSKKNHLAPWGDKYIHINDMVWTNYKKTGSVHTMIHAQQAEKRQQRWHIDQFVLTHKQARRVSWVIEAGQAIFQSKKNLIWVTQHPTIIKKMPQQKDMIIRGKQFTINLKQQIITSKKPITIKQNNNVVHAQSMTLIWHEHTSTLKLGASEAIIRP